MREKIRALRLERGLGQYELGAAIGVRYLTICRWENGVQKPYKRHIESLAKFFGVTERELMSDDDKSKETMMENENSP